MNKTKRKLDDADSPIPEGIYPAIDNDLARDNLENDLTEADKQDLNFNRGRR